MFYFIMAYEILIISNFQLFTCDQQVSMNKNWLLSIFTYLSKRLKRKYAINVSLIKNKSLLFMPQTCYSNSEEEKNQT